jgi:hypothetical protein
MMMVTVFRILQTNVQIQRPKRFQILRVAVFLREILMAMAGPIPQNWSVVMITSMKVMCPTPLVQQARGQVQKEIRRYSVVGFSSFFY